MPGTGKHGYTGPSLYGGSYNISNGIIQSGSGATSSGTASRNSPYGSSNNVSKVTQNLGSALASVYPSNEFASGIAGVAGRDSSDYGDYIRELLDISANNTAQSQAFAREQMDFQRQSDATAMAWSAQEAQKNREWQERLSNTAHQREVEDLVAAGLNPILAANGGAYTGSGATGQAFSSSGAMGTVDQMATGAIGSLLSTVMNTASQAAIAGIYTDAEKYSADMSYAQAKLASETSIFNNNNSISANRIITQMNNEADIQKANISAAGARAAAAASAGGMIRSAEINQETQKWLNEHQWTQNPVDYAGNAVGSVVENIVEPTIDILKETGILDKSPTIPPMGTSAWKAYTHSTGGQSRKY